MTRVSVVIPAYNAMAYLPATLESALKQTFDDFEVLIIDDGSSDNIKDWFFSQSIDPRARLICQPNGGLSKARNTGILHSSGEYIAFLDADDLWESEKLEKQVAILDNDLSAGLVYSWIACIDEFGRFTGRIRGSTIEGMVWAELVKGNFVQCGSVPLVRRDCFSTVGLFDESLRSVEDLDLWLRIAKLYSFRVVKEPLVYYRQHSTSLSKNWLLMESCFHKVIDRAFSDAFSEFMTLKRQSYASAYLCLAWKPIQQQNMSPRQSMHFLGKAIRHYPKVVMNAEFLFLLAAISLACFLDRKRYLSLLSHFYRLRRRSAGASQQLIKKAELNVAMSVR